jgi:hypothetical protein
MVTKKKKVAKRKTAKKKKSVSARSSSSGPVGEERLIRSLIARDEILVDNFVGLQKALVNVSVKFNELTERIDKLLDIYQRAADVFIQKQIKEGDRRVELDRKVGTVMQQNKQIARRQVMMQQPPRSGPSPTMPLPPGPSSAPQEQPPGIPSIANQAPSPGVIPQAPGDSTKPQPLPKL